MSIVLVIDGDGRSRDFIGAILESFGHRVVAAPEGREGLRALGNNLPDAILLDVGFPGLSGIRLCRSLKGDSRCGGVPVVLMTAVVTSGLAAQCRSTGAAGILQKPFGEMDLLLALAACFEAPPYQASLRKGAAGSPEAL